MPDELHEIEFERYAGLLRQLLGEDWLAALYTDSDELVWCSKADLDPPRPGVDEDALRTTSVDIRRLQPIPSADDGAYWSLPLSSHCSDYIGHLVIGKPGAPEPPEALTERLNDLVNELARCIVSEVDSLVELNAMAGELSQRYEELNLIYSLDEIASSYRPEEGRRTLLRLVEDSSRFLDVDAVNLLFPAERMEIHQVSPDLDQDELTTSVLSQLRPILYGHIRQSGEPLVVNSEDDEFWRDLGFPHLVNLIASPVMDKQGRLYGMLSVSRSTDKEEFTNGDRKLVKVLSDQAGSVIHASRDDLTGLYNRLGFEGRLQEAQLALGNTGRSHALLYLDIDDFKVVNDGAGHAAGDELLRQVGSLLEAQTRNSDLVGRIDADAFAILLEDCSIPRAMGLADKIIDLLKRYVFTWKEHTFNVSAGIGIVPVHNQDLDIGALLNTADIACFLAHQEGKGRKHLYSVEDDAFIQHHQAVEWVPKLTAALRDNRFQLYCQPLIPLAQAAISNSVPCEVLLRLKDDDGSILSPFAFIPAAERFQMMPKLDLWVVRSVLEILEEVHATGPAEPPHCALNLSGQSFADPDFLVEIFSLIEATRVPPEWITFEVTETAAMSNMGTALNFMRQLTDRGYRFSLDDFGSGLSSFAYLKELPVSKLKIDGVFVKDLHTNPVSRGMVEAMQRIAEVMNLETVAEFVENAAIVTELERIGIHYAQGYHFARPLPFVEWLAGLNKTVARSQAG